MRLSSILQLLDSRAPEGNVMLAYQIRNAFRSIRRNPVLSALLIAAIGLGIGVSTAFITTYYLLAGDPIPEKSDRLFYVELDSWDPNRPYDDDHPERPPEQITYRDMRRPISASLAARTASVVSCGSRIANLRWSG